MLFLNWWPPGCIAAAAAAAAAAGRRCVSWRGGSTTETAAPRPGSRPPSGGGWRSSRTSASGMPPSPCSGGGGAAARGRPRASACSRSGTKPRLGTARGSRVVSTYWCSARRCVHLCACAPAFVPAASVFCQTANRAPSSDTHPIRRAADLLRYSLDHPGFHRCAAGGHQPARPGLLWSARGVGGPPVVLCTCAAVQVETPPHGSPSHAVKSDRELPQCPCPRSRSSTHREGISDRAGASPLQVCYGWTTRGAIPRQQSASTATMPC